MMPVIAAGIARQAAAPYSVRRRAILAALGWWLAAGLFLGNHTALGAEAEARSQGMGNLFGYVGTRQSSGFDIFPQWQKMLARKAKEDQAGDKCDPKESSCPVLNWQHFLASLAGKSLTEQLAAVNAYGNRKKYVQDIDNYGVDDYWATPRQFLYNNGDCEDYAIFKYFSLKQLGVSIDTMRIIAVQDTNLRIAHAVLAVQVGHDVYILDNQTDQVVPQSEITHYVPIYGINEHAWWVYMPR